MGTLKPQAVDRGTSWCPDMAEVRDGDVFSCQSFSKTVLVFWEEPAAITAVLPQEDGVCTASLVQQVQRTLSLAELPLE